MNKIKEVIVDFYNKSTNNINLFMLYTNFHFLFSLDTLRPSDNRCGPEE